MNLEGASTALVYALDEAANEGRFEPMLKGIKDVILGVNINVGRLAIPLHGAAGFRHPTLYAVQLMWTAPDDAYDTTIITHEHHRAYLAELAHAEKNGADAAKTMIASPYHRAAESENGVYRVNLNDDELDLDILKDLRRSGYRDYLVFSVPMPGSQSRQALSLAAFEPFPEDVFKRLEPIKGLLSLTLYAAYRTSQAMRLADVYLGRQTGRRVLSGEIVRGQTDIIESGLMFCDVRGFTALSERLGGQAMVGLMNELFSAIGQHAESRGGEILKFIGDAMLVIFPVEDGHQPQVARQMMSCVTESVAQIEALAASKRLDLGVGFGCHFGRVVYGNVGTPTRLDFTVMGPAVNLASRLEGLTKALGVTAVFSDRLAEYLPELQSRGNQTVKGVREPVSVYTLPLP
ncbi:MAG: adenylate/guanylate cyclase domain-containing protein [Bradymonadia bacterium]